jgi:predicted  nucleic acid-binding Zn-ribbon protein
MRPKEIIILVVLGLLVVSIIAGYFVWKSDAFQRTYFPKRYYESEVARLDWAVRIDQWTLRGEQIEFRKKYLTAALDVAARVNDAEFFGTDIEKAQEEAAAEVREELSLQRDMLKHWQTLLDEDRRRLQRTRQELSKYR